MNCETKWIIVGPEMLGIHFDLIINSENVLANKRNVSNEHTHTMSLLVLLLPALSSWLLLFVSLQLLLPI